MRRPFGLQSLAALAVPLAVASCAGSMDTGFRPCSVADAASHASCEAGLLCVAGRCRPEDVLPAPPDASRVVLEPVQIAAIAPHGRAGGDEPLPGVVALGRDESGSLILLLRFAATWRDDAEIAGAFVVLRALDLAPPPAGPTRFEVARILEPWQAQVVSWGRQPRLEVPRSGGSVWIRPRVPIRIDVTPLVRAWGRRDASDHGIAIMAQGQDAFGASVSTGLGGGIGPRLEVYLK